jgi:hypothetical protein
MKGRKETQMAEKSGLKPLLSEADAKFLASYGVKVSRASVGRKVAKGDPVVEFGITQAQLDEFLTLRNVARKVNALLYQRREQIVESLASGSEVEPGMHTCNINDPGKPWAKLTVH